LQVIQDTVDEGIIDAARKSLEAIEQKRGTNATTQVAQQTLPDNQTLLSDKIDLKELVHSAESLRSSERLEINTLKPGDNIDDRYKFIKKIGKGAFGTVLLVQDSAVQENLVLKFINPTISQDEDAMKRFVHELRYSRKITHKNVIRIYDFVYMRGLYAISMEYFPSHPLNKEIIDEQPLPLQKAIQFGCDISVAMMSAHNAGIIHRDLKPANILVNESGELKVVDFGVAAAHKENDTQLTKTGFVIGSPKYMAPEQIMGKTVDARSDIYSLGIILYEMLVGIPPYSKGDHMSVMYQHVKGQAIPPFEINPKKNIFCLRNILNNIFLNNV
jgi:serine/threonine-protein kinase